MAAFLVETERLSSHFVNEFRAQRIFQRLLYADINTTEDEHGAKHPDARGQRDNDNSHYRSQCVARGEHEVLAETIGQPTCDKGESGLESIVRT